MTLFYLFLIAILWQKIDKTIIFLSCGFAIAVSILFLKDFGFDHGWMSMLVLSSVAINVVWLAVLLFYGHKFFGVLSCFFCSLVFFTIHLLPWPEKSLSPTILFHSAFALLAYVFSLAAMVQGIFVFFHYRFIKSHNVLFRRLPNLEQLSYLQKIFSQSAFLLLTVALFSGVVFIEDIFAQHLAHKIFFAFCAWLVLLFLLIKKIIGYKMRLVLLILVFVFLQISYFTTQFILQQLGLG